jgi:hypothetical protein
MATAITDSPVISEGALCACSRGHLRLFPSTHLQGVRPKRSLSPGLPSTPDDAPALRESIMARPSPGPLRHVAETRHRHAVDVHHSTSCLHHPAATPKTMPQRGRATPNAPPSSDLGDPDLGSSRSSTSEYAMTAPAMPSTR